MPKSQQICPKENRAPGFIHFQPIPLNQYSKRIEDEQNRYTKERLIGIQHDMMIIRTFETMLNEIKLRGSYQGVAYDHKGPAHLSLGQEAAAVGMAFHLTIDDHIYGSHRSHGDSGQGAVGDCPTGRQDPDGDHAELL